MQPPLTCTGIQHPLTCTGIQHPLTCTGIQHPLTCTGIQHPLTCTGIQHPLTCTGIHHPLTCTGMQCSVTCAGIQHPLTCAEMQHPLTSTRMQASQTFVSLWNLSLFCNAAPSDLWEMTLSGVSLRMEGYVGCTKIGRSPQISGLAFSPVVQKFSHHCQCIHRDHGRELETRNFYNVVHKQKWGCHEPSNLR